MNKNRLSGIILFLLCFLPFSLVLITTASFLELSEDLSIVGNGTFDRDFSAQSARDFSGQKLTETIVPVFSSHGAFATSSYRSNFELIVSNNSSIFYEAVSDLPTSKHYLSSQNYELGVYTGFYYIGAQNKTFLFESSPSLSEAAVMSEVEGRSVLRVRVVNESFSHDRYVDDLTWLVGNFSLEWNFLVMDIDYPEAGEENDEWLWCPGGATFP